MAKLRKSTREYAIPMELAGGTTAYSTSTYNEKSGDVELVKFSIYVDWASKDLSAMIALRNLIDSIIDDNKP
jgi:hypothetical protein